MTEQQHIRSGHSGHLILDGGLPRPKPTDSCLLCPSHIDPDRELPQRHGQFNEFKLDIHEFDDHQLDFHKADLYRTSTNRSHRCQRRRRRAKRCPVARSVRTGRSIWPPGWLCLWSDFITTERNGCWYRRSHHWRSPLHTLVITWTSVPSFFSIIPWIENGRCVTDIYEYVDTDFMIMNFFACKLNESREQSRAATAPV
jgi:hypothetical protein